MSAAQPVSEEEAVYRSYVAAFKAMTSFEERSIESYLSAMARVKLAEARAKRSARNCDPCPSAEQELQIAKAVRPYPGSDVRPVRSVSGGVVVLTFKWHEAPGGGELSANGMDLTVKVELVREQGWKLKSESWVTTERSGTMTMQARSVWSY